MQIKRLKTELGDRHDKEAIADAGLAMMQARSAGWTVAEQAATCIDAYMARVSRDQNEEYRREQEDEP